MTAARLKLKTRIESNWLCVTSVSRKELGLERQLHQSKWFDYRFISPMEATSQFRDEYIKMHQRYYAHNISTEGSEKRIGVRVGPAFQTRTELTSFWRARQKADLYGFPYNVFIELAFETLTRGGWTRLPHINQLYAERNFRRICTAAAAYWEELQQARLDKSFSHLPEYRLESYHEFSAQKAHRAWVLESLKKRGAHAIGRAYFLHRVISPELALAEFGEKLFSRARERLTEEEEVPEPIEACAIEELLPSCFGLPGALAPTSPECRACPAMDRCGRMEGVTRRHLELRTGSENPEHERRKKQGQERVRRHRKKKALAAAGTSATSAP